MKKKIILGILVAIVAVVVIAVVVVASKLDSIVEAGIETVGPELTKTTIEVDKVSIKPFSGSGALHGLVVGSPEGYKAEYTMKMGLAQLALQPGSLTSDKIVIEDITVEGPEIILEGGLKENNLTAIQKNVNDVVGGETGEQPAEPAKQEPAGGAQVKLQVNHFKLAGAKVHLRLSVLAGKNITITAPDVELKDLGTGPEGITAGELVKRALNALTTDVLAAAAKSVADVGSKAVGAATDAAGGAVDAAAKQGTEAVGKATEGLKNLFKKSE